MVKEGYSFGVPLLLLGGVSFLLQWYVATAVLVFLAAFVFSLFGDPDGVTPGAPGDEASRIKKKGKDKGGKETQHGVCYIPLQQEADTAQQQQWYVATAVLVFLAAFVFSFFRDPER